MSDAENPSLRPFSKQVEEEGQVGTNSGREADDGVRPGQL